MSTKINEWKIMGDGSLKAKVRGKSEDGAEHYILHINYFMSEREYAVDIYDDWADLVTNLSSPSVIELFNFISKETKISLAKLTDLMVEVEKIQQSALKAYAEKDA